MAFIYQSANKNRAIPRKSALVRLAAREDNVDVLRDIRFMLLCLLLVGACLVASGQTQDRDTRGLPKTTESAPPPALRVDINHASVDDLLKVPGLTPTWAARIVRFRPYRAKTDLLENGVVNDTVYNRIKDYVIAHKN